MENKLSKAIQLRLSDHELAEIDAYCSAQRRRTGDPISRSEVIRSAIATFIAAHKAAKS